MMPVMDAQVAIKGNDAKNGTVYLQINPSVVERICHDVIWLPEYIIQSSTLSSRHSICVMTELNKSYSPTVDVVVNSLYFIPKFRRFLC